MEEINWEKDQSGVNSSGGESDSDFTAEIDAIIEDSLYKNDVQSQWFKALDIFTTSTSKQPSEATMHMDTNDKHDNGEHDINDYLYVQEAANIIHAAYKEIMTLALKENTWVVGTPAVGSIEEFLTMFRSLPPSGMRVECSIASAILPICPANLVSMLMNMKLWASQLLHIVRGASIVPCDLLKRFLPDIKFEMVEAEFHLPTPFVPPWKSRFLRCQKEIRPGIWAIIDVSDSYFSKTISESTSEPKYRRRPSAVIIRRNCECAEVIWIENVEVHESLAGKNIYSSITSSDLPFSASHWVTTLSQKLKRNDCMMMTFRVQTNRKALRALKGTTAVMERVYLRSVNGLADECKWILLSDKDVRIWKSRYLNRIKAIWSDYYIAVTSFRIPRMPLSIVNFLAGKDLELQWPNLLNVDPPEELIKFATKDGNYCATLHRRVEKLSKKNEYVLQQISLDEFLSLVISSSITQQDMDSLLINGTKELGFLRPSGFAVMPDGLGGLNSDASLVTVVLCQEWNCLEADEAIVIMTESINCVIDEICKRFTEKKNDQNQTSS